ncbi:hypothetical protein POTOM_054546 [Populus tomentosa]|uniref:Uncharacterized protein n=1 Tax=Populus tomentosa TaxID=118781 RepID=A0A8X7XVW0_POPTO|nr:hypothetical protein POTOM_054546 [Populus tomentosa]
MVKTKKIGGRGVWCSVLRPGPDRRVDPGLNELKKTHFTLSREEEQKTLDRPFNSEHKFVDPSVLPSVDPSILPIDRPTGSSHSWEYYASSYVLPPAKSSLREKMEKALSLLEDSLGSRCFPVQTFLFGYVIMDFQNGLQIFVIYRPNECLYLSDAISCGVGGIIALPPVFESDQPKYCCAVLEFVTKEEKHDFDLETEKVFQAS